MGRDIVLNGQYVYVASSLIGLVVIDVSDLTNPRLINTLSFSGSVSGLTFSDGYLYLTEEGNGLHILDISDPASPSQVGFFNVSDCNSGVFVSGNYAYLSSNARSIVIVDINDKSAPTLAGELNESGRSNKVFVQGNYAYLVGENGFAIVDVSSVSSPHVVFTYVPQVGFFWPSVYVDDRYVYLPTGPVTIFDITNPEDPIEIYDGTEGCCGASIVVSDGFIYMAGASSNLRIYSFNPPE